MRSAEEQKKESDEDNAKRETAQAVADEEAIVEAKYTKYKEENKFEIVDKLGENDGYIISVKCATKAEVVSAMEGLEQMGNFKAHMSRTFMHGVLDGIKHYRRELAKLGGMYGKALVIGDRLSVLIQKNM